VKLTGTNRPITYTTAQSGQETTSNVPAKEGLCLIMLLASTMWFPDNKPVGLLPVEHDHHAVPDPGIMYGWSIKRVGACP
jgi:hypothetical protein